MLRSIIASLFILLIACHGTASWADSPISFADYMNEWNEKRDLATKNLLEAEQALKEGDKKLSCIYQRKAGANGIEATQSLIKAMKSNGSTDGIENFEAGLNKWKELRDFC